MKGSTVSKILDAHLSALEKPTILYSLSGALKTAVLQILTRFENAYDLSELTEQRVSFEVSRTKGLSGQTQKGQEPCKGFFFVSSESTVSIDMAMALGSAGFRTVLLLTDRLSPEFLQESVRSQFTHVVAIDPDGFYERLIEAHLKKSLRNNFFGLETMFSAKSAFRTVIVKNSEDRSQCRQSLWEFVKSFELSVGRSLNWLANHSAMVQEELLMNAIWDANPEKAQMDRRSFPDLQTEEFVEVNWAFDGSFLAVSVTDPFGTFPEEIIEKYQRFLYANDKKELVKLRDDGEGAGIGLYMVLKRVTGFEVTVNPGVRTEVTAYFNVKYGLRQASRQLRSFQFRKLETKE